MRSANQCQDPWKCALYPATVQLEGITSFQLRKLIPVYQDTDYSVLDYEFMDDNLLILVYGIGKEPL